MKYYGAFCSVLVMLTGCDADIDTDAAASSNADGIAATAIARSETRRRLLAP